MKRRNFMIGGILGSFFLIPRALAEKLEYTFSDNTEHFVKFFEDLNGFKPTQLQLNWFEKLENCSDRYKDLYAGRRDGKTVFLNTYIIWKCQFQDNGKTVLHTVTPYNFETLIGLLSNPRIKYKKCVVARDYRKIVIRWNKNILNIISFNNPIFEDALRGYMCDYAYCDHTWRTSWSEFESIFECFISSEQFVF